MAECNPVMLPENILVLHRFICPLHICVVFGRAEECKFRGGYTGNTIQAASFFLQSDIQQMLHLSRIRHQELDFGVVRQYSQIIYVLGCLKGTMLNRGLSNIGFRRKQLIDEDTLHGDRLDVKGTYFINCFQYSPLLLGGQIIEHSRHL